MKYFLFIKNYSLSQDAAFITKGDFISNPTAAQQVKWHSVFGGESFNCLESVVMVMTFFFLLPAGVSRQCSDKPRQVEVKIVVLNVLPFKVHF